MPPLFKLLKRRGYAHSLPILLCSQCIFWLIPCWHPVHSIFRGLASLSQFALFISVVSVPPLGDIIIIALPFAFPNWYHGDHRYQELWHFASIMTKCADKNSMWLGVQVADIKIWSLNLFSINRNTIICTWHILVINGFICKFLLKWGKTRNCLRICGQGWEQWVSGWNTEVFEKHFLNHGKYVMWDWRAWTIFLPLYDEPFCVGNCIQRCNDISKNSLSSLLICFSFSLVYCSKRRVSRKELVFTEHLQQSGMVLSTFMNGIKFNPKKYYFTGWEYSSSRHLPNMCKRQAINM